MCYSSNGIYTSIVATNTIEKFLNQAIVKPIARWLTTNYYIFLALL